MPHPKVKISDNSGSTVDITGNALDVNIASGTADIDIGDVSLLLDGTVADYGTGNVNTTGRTLRVTLASNDAQFGELADSADIDGTLHGKLRYIAQNSLDAPQTGSGSSGHQQMGQVASVGSTGKVMLAERNDTLAIPSGVDTGDWSCLQVNASGALYVEVASSATLSVNSHAVTNAGTFATQIDGSALTALEHIADAVYADDANFTLNTNKGIALMAYNGSQNITANDIGVLTCNAYGVLLVSGWQTMGTTLYAETVTTGMVAGVVRNDELVSLVGTDNEIAPLQVSAEGALYTTHGITGLASDDNDTVGLSAEKISGVDGDVACKRVDIMSHPNNTGYIWIGDSAITTNGANGGIRLSPGDFYSMDIDNTGDVYAIATVDGDNVCFNYYT